MFKFENEQHEHSFNVAKDTIIALSTSQGMYSRLREGCENDGWEALYQTTKEHYFDDGVDFILWWEG